MSYHSDMPRKPKTELEKLLEESIKLAKAHRAEKLAGGKPKVDSLGDRLRSRLQAIEEAIEAGPDSLDDPDEIELEADKDAEAW